MRCILTMFSEFVVSSDVNYVECYYERKYMSVIDVKGVKCVKDRQHAVYYTKSVKCVMGIKSVKDVKCTISSSTRTQSMLMILSCCKG